VGKTIKIAVFIIGFLFIARFLLQWRSHSLLCQSVRDTMDQFTAEVKIPPKSAQELVRFGYLSDASVVEGCDLFPAKSK
jgi:hypothetical protein